jgi:hypothetical protein
VATLYSQMFKISTTIPNILLIITRNSGILLAGLQQRQFQFCASGPAVFLVFWCAQCSLNHPTRKCLVVSSQEVGMDIPHSSFALPIISPCKSDEHWFHGHQSHDSIVIQASCGLHENLYHYVSTSTASWTARYSTPSSGRYISLYRCVQTVLRAAQPPKADFFPGIKTARAWN